MKLVDKVLAKRLEAYPLFSQSGMGYGAKVLAKYVVPATDAVWLVYEGEQQDNDDWVFSVYMTLDGEHWSYGVVMLSTLEGVADPYGRTVERDVRFKPQSIRSCMRRG